MGHVLAHVLQEAGLRPRVGLDGHESNHEALLRGEIDIYVEYTGTALLRFLNREPLPREAVFPTVRREAKARWDIVWFEPFGFDNTFALIASARRARDLGLTRISDLRLHASELSVGSVQAFFDGGPEQRFAPGGYEGLCRHYGLAFRRIEALPREYGATLDALHRGQVDLVVDFPVNPRMIAYDLVEITDDQQFFSAYYAAAVARGEFLRAHPRVDALISRLAWRVDNPTIARLNHRVEFGGEDPRVVAQAFLAGLRREAR